MSTIPFLALEKLIAGVDTLASNENLGTLATGFLCTVGQIADAATPAGDEHMADALALSHELVAQFAGRSVACRGWRVEIDRHTLSAHAVRLH